MKLYVLLSSSALIGFIHSLAPAHWIPVVLVSRSRGWNRAQTILGALVAASGHILLSITVAFVFTQLGIRYVEEYEHQVEIYSGWILIGLGLIYAGYYYVQHRNCRGHTHHGPEKKHHTAPLVFLFFVGFLPCMAVLPVLITAMPMGVAATLGASLSFSFGVIAALVGASWLVSLGFKKFDHKILEHYGEVMTGIMVALLGAVLLGLGHHH